MSCRRISTTTEPRILLLGDYSNCHCTLAKGLRNLGCNVTVASDGSGWMNVKRDLNLNRSKGLTGGLLHFLDLRYGWLSGSLKGYDIVALKNPSFLDLRPGPTRLIYDWLRHNNGKIFLTSMSTDCAFLDMLQSNKSPLIYNEWFINGKPNRLYIHDKKQWDSWHGKEIQSLHNYVFDTVDGAVSILYEYQMAMEFRLGKDRTCYGGIPIEIPDKPVDIPENPDKIRLFLGRDKSRKLLKGSDLLEYAASEIVSRHPENLEFTLIENRPFAEFQSLLSESHIVLDQIYSYTPATTALMAMANGQVTVSGGEPDFYDFIDEHHNRPVVNAPLTLDGIVNTLENLISEPTMIRKRGLDSRDFVIKHNDVTEVAKRFLNFWLSKS